LEDQKATLLIVEDDLDIAEMLDAYFRVQGYNVLTANWGEDGVRLCNSSHPDLVILDIRLPDIDGFAVAERLRSNRRTGDIPIIFLTERRERNDRLRGLSLRAEDYITKPFDIQELRLRVRNALHSSKRGALTNPVTSFPQGMLVNERLDVVLKESGWSLIVVSLDHLDHFREVYGFVASDDLMRAVSLMLEEVHKVIGGKEDFLGHLTPSDFLLITRPDKTSVIIERITQRLEKSLRYFYRDQDRDAEIFTERELKVHIEEVLTDPGEIPDMEALQQKLTRLHR
jgi:DNA-binding response OmpR family regulator